MFKNILLPVDVGQMERTTAMIGSIQSIAQGENVRVVLLNVIAEIPGYVAAQLPPNHHQNAISESKALLDGLVKNTALEKNSEVVVEEGNAAQVILRVAKQRKTDLIVIGSHNPGIADYLLGSVAARVVRHASCSVMVVR
ncbi:MAG: universal stress protein [Burkholderiaceae bacterium]